MTQENTDYFQRKLILFNQIKIMTERIHYAESRRNGFLIIAAALFATGVSFLNYALADLSTYFNYSLCLMSSIFILLSIVICTLYARQTNFYPFTNVNKNKIWFYRDALKDSGKFKVDILYYLFGRKETEEKIEKEFYKQYDFYKNNMTEYITNIDEGQVHFCL